MFSESSRDKQQQAQSEATPLPQHHQDPLLHVPRLGKLEALPPSQGFQPGAWSQEREAALSFAPRRPGVCPPSHLDFRLCGSGLL